MRSNPLIIFATYWNERYFIEPSLEQIKALNPVEVIICDGCFDTKFPDHSTDGTREIIKKFVEENHNVRLISPIRPNIVKSAWLLLRGHGHLPWWTIFRPVRWKFLLSSFLRVPYRRNQAITFNHMISLSKQWKLGIWFMTYDADQFYGDEMIGKMKKILNDESETADLIAGSEITFFNDFKHCTSFYEKRISSNMPHRIYKDTLIQPTRSIIRETKSGSGFLNFRDVLAKHLYARFAKTVHAGVYFHYKISSRERFQLGYKLGDRKKPDIDQYKEERFTMSHPKIFKKYFNL